jgi:hypothetical protein
MISYSSSSSSARGIVSVDRWVKEIRYGTYTSQCNKEDIANGDGECGAELGERPLLQLIADNRVHRVCIA